MDLPAAGGMDAGARRAATRDLLASLPPPVALQVAQGDRSKPPLPGVDAMLRAVQDGSHVVSDTERAAPFWRALERAASTFEDADDLWSTARELLNADELPGAVAFAAADTNSKVDANAGSEPSTAGAALIDGTSTDDPLAVLGGELPAWQLDWWQWVLDYVIPATTGPSAGTDTQAGSGE